jgi:threonine dehydratase
VVDNLNTVYVPVGLGSGICGMIGMRDALGLKTKIVGVVAEAANAYLRSFTAGRVVATNSALTFADGMAVRVPDPTALEVIRKGAERIVPVSDDEIAEAIRSIYSATHNCAEGAGAAALAALSKERGRLQGRRAAVQSLLTDYLHGSLQRISLLNRTGNFCKGTWNLYARNSEI